MRRLMLVASCLMLAGAAPAFGQSGAERYTVTEIDGGIVRVDRYTGEVSVCSARDGIWTCELVPDDRQALTREMDSLRQENRQLRHDGSGDGLGGRDLGEFRPRVDDDLGDGIVTREEIDQAMDSFEYMMQRLMGAAERLRPAPPPPRY